MTTGSVFANTDALRDHLDALNESGTDPTVAGIDANGRAFLITLQGPYAETEAVLFGVPWDGEIDWNSPLRCSECGCHEAFGIQDLTYPVRLAVVPAPHPSEAQR